jgi:poly(3-hydroxyalkanoate) synthetase
MIHGSFSNRGFWLSRKGKGFAAYLVKEGYDVWLMDVRGHGLSPFNDQYNSNNVESYAKFDIPAVNDFVCEQTQKKPQWVGHSLGGLTIATAIAGGYLAEDKINGVITFGTQASLLHWSLKIPLATTVAKAGVKFMKSISGVALRIGPEDEPKGIAYEQFRWFGLFRRWKGGDGQEYWKNLSQVAVPWLSVIAAQDRNDSAKNCLKLFSALPENQRELMMLSKADQYSREYGHIDMVVSKSAAKEVWPKVEEWIRG